MMSVLPDHHIRRNVIAYDLIHPFSLDQLQPASYDVKLRNDLQIPHARDPRVIDLKDPTTIRGRTEQYVMDDRGFAIYPGRFVLAGTQEIVKIPRTIVGRIEGKSSLARLGIQIHSAGYLDPGFIGSVTLEIVNFFDSAVVIYPDILIAQLSFEYLTEPCNNAYAGRYQNAPSVQESRYHPEGKMSDR